MDEAPVDITTYSRRQWLERISAVVCVVAAGAAVAFGVTHSTVTVTGEAKANAVAVFQAAADNKAAAEAAAAEQRRRDEAAALASLEDEVRVSMQEFFDDPENMRYDRIAVKSVSLFKTGDNIYEGMARMSANGGTERDIGVHVRADDLKLQWSTDEGALLPLFR